MDTTCVVKHFSEHGRLIPITARHEAVGTRQCGLAAVVKAILPPFAGALTSETELAQLNMLAITRDAGLGDCLMMMPVVRKLRALFPKLWMHVYVPEWTLGVMEWAVADDRKLAIFGMNDHDAEDYVKTVNLSWYCERQPEERIAVLDRIGIFARAFGIELRPIEKRWRLMPPDDVPTILDPIDKPTIALGLESAAPHRAPTPGLAIRIGKAVLARGARLVLLGRNPPEAEVYKALARNGSTEVVANQDLTDVAGMMYKTMDCLISGDTGVYHLAGALRTPFVALFGAIPPSTRLSGYQDYAAFSAQGKLPCVPCLERPEHIGCQPFPSCMDQLDADMIADKAMAFAERRWKQKTDNNSGERTH